MASLSNSQRQEMLKQLLEQDCQFPLTIDLVSESTSCGQVDHIFSHVKHRMFVYSLQLSQQPPSLPAPSSKCQWLSSDEIHQCGLTTGMRKVLKQIASPSSSLPLKRQSASQASTVSPKQGKFECSDVFFPGFHGIFQVIFPCSKKDSIILPCI